MSVALRRDPGLVSLLAARADAAVRPGRTRRSPSSASPGPALRESIALEFLRREGEVAPARLRAALSWSDRTARRVLGALVRRALATRTARGRYAAVESPAGEWPMNGQNWPVERPELAGRTANGQWGVRGADPTPSLETQTKTAAAAAIELVNEAARRTANGHANGQPNGQTDMARALEIIAVLIVQNAELRERAGEPPMGRVSPGKGPEPQRVANVPTVEGLVAAPDEEVAIAERFAQMRDAGDPVRLDAVMREIVIRDCRSKPAVKHALLNAAAERQKRDGLKAKELAELGTFEERRAKARADDARQRVALGLPGATT